MTEKIKLLKNNDNRTDSDIEKVREFYRFLTGEEMPEKISIRRGNTPKMSEKKAFIGKLKASIIVESAVILSLSIMTEVAVKLSDKLNEIYGNKFTTMKTRTLIAVLLLILMTAIMYFPHFYVKK